VSVRVLGGIYKMSLHKDGKCQFGFTDQYADSAEERFEVKERHLERWKLPDEKVVRALQILIPALELREIDVGEAKEVTWLKSPLKGTIGTISVFICKPGATLEISDDSEHGWLIGQLKTSIRSAWVTYAFTYPDEALQSLIENERHRLASILEGNSIPPGSRAVLWDSKDGHDRHILELACD
jgi:hypothetical protein